MRRSISVLAIVIVGMMGDGQSLGAQIIPSTGWALGGASVSAPATDRDGNLYIASEDRYLYAFDASATLRWRHNLLQRPVCCLAALPAGGITVGLRTGELVMVSGAGERLWGRRPNDALPLAVVVSESEIIHLFYEDGGYFAFNMAGRRLWSAQMEGAIVVPPVSLLDGRIFIASDGDLLSARDRFANPLWRRRLGTPITALSASLDNRLFVGGADGTIVAIDAEGEPIWRASGHGVPTSILHDGAGPTFAIYDNGAMHSFDREGQSLWRLDGYRITEAILSEGGRLLATDLDGHLLEIYSHRNLSRIGLLPESEGLFAPAINANGSLVAIGANWVLYSFPIKAALGTGWLAGRGNAGAGGLPTPSRNAPINASIRPPLHHRLQGRIASGQAKHKMEALEEIERRIAAADLSGDYGSIVETLLYAAGERHLYPTRLNNRIVNDFPTVRSTAAHLLGRIGDAGVRERLVGLARVETSRVALLAILEALTALGGDPDGIVAELALQVVRRELAVAPSAVIVSAALRTLDASLRQRGRFGDGEILKTLEWLQTGTADNRTRQAALRLLRRYTR